MYVTMQRCCADKLRDSEKVDVSKGVKRGYTHCRLEILSWLGGTEAKAIYGRECCFKNESSDTAQL